MNSDFYKMPERFYNHRSRSVDFNSYIKRCFDIVVASVMIITFLPLLLTVSCWLKSKYGGCIFFGHRRIGRNGLPFNCMKFRTMAPDAEERLEMILNADSKLRRQWQRDRKLDPDPRIIPGIGVFLRNSSLDELPQLWNILVGDMSFVGPRPVTEDELPNYGDYVGHYLAVRPGLTGPWQIGGRSDVSYSDRVLADVEYVESASVATDFRIFAKTVFYFVTGRLMGGR
jgi:lipopolysaccharide/colanic/teichoic acid biosynthesis glycosyltransferase